MLFYHHFERRFVEQLQKTIELGDKACISKLRMESPQLLRIKDDNLLVSILTFETNRIFVQKGNLLPPFNEGKLETANLIKQN